MDPEAQPAPDVEPALPRGPHPPRRPRRWLPVALFFATCGTTLWVGVQTFPVLERQGPTVVIQWGPTLLNAAAYSLSVMLILLTHEMGHYLQALRYGVHASWPYFIPMPVPPFGTMGAVIALGADTADRRQLYDIGITGPIAGLMVAIPVLWFGLLDVETMPLPKNQSVMLFADPLILTWMAEAIHGPRPEGHEYMLNPLLLAGWVGMFITSLNLIPIGQLDGGHVLYAMIGRWAHYVAYGLIATAVVFMVVSGFYGFVLLLALLIFFGPKHPPTADDRVPLGVGRYVLGWLMLAFILIGFTPRPIVQSVPEGLANPPAQKKENEGDDAAAIRVRPLSRAPTERPV